MFLLALPALAGTYQLCSRTESSATANGTWHVLDRQDRDGRNDRRVGGNYAASTVIARFGDERDEDLCPADDPMGGITRNRTTEMVAIDLLPDQLGGACPSRSVAEGAAEVEGAAWASARGIRAGASGSALVQASAENAAGISVDGGAGGVFTGEWSWRVPGPNARLTATAIVGELEAYAGAVAHVPGLLWVEAYDGRVDAWVREGDRFVHHEGAAPMTLTAEAVLPGRSGQVCATGSATGGVASDHAAGERSGGASIEVVVDAVQTADAPTFVSAGSEEPEFAVCGCR